MSCFRALFMGEYKNMSPAEKHDNPATARTDHSGVSWGPKLFWLTLVLMLVFFWWLLIYSHGVEVHHG